MSRSHRLTAAARSPRAQQSPNVSEGECAFGRDPNRAGIGQPTPPATPPSASANASANTTDAGAPPSSSNSAPHSTPADRRQHTSRR